MRVGRAVTCIALALAAAAAVAAPAAAQQYLNILDFGAVPDADTAAAGWANGAALNAALTASNTSAAPAPSERIVLVPAGHTFTFIPAANTLTGLHNVWLQIDGDIVALKQVNLTTRTAVWPYDAAAGKFHDMIAWNDCSDMWVYGSGRVEGNGYEWWWASVLKTIDDASRPHMFVVNGGARLHWSGLRLKNSPEYHMILTDIDTLLVENMDITVDVDVQRKLLADHGLLDEFGVPIFPLNTDGIDPAGKNVLIRNVSISNFDDAVAVKPCNGGFRYATCSQDIVVEDSRVTWGLGMTIGSVPPHEQVNCVRNVVFRRVNFTFPIKAVYVKTNPGNTGSGVISNITYEDLRGTDAVWWAIYIGPQQQKQPDGDGAGCLLYPINPDCPCQPRVPMDHITLRNVQIDGALFSPGIIRCNATAPCTDFVFDNVQVTKYGQWPWGQTAYKVDNVYGTCTNCSPNIPFTGANPPEADTDAAAASDDAKADAEADPFAPVKRAFDV